MLLLPPFTSSIPIRIKASLLRQELANERISFSNSPFSSSDAFKNLYWSLLKSKSTPSSPYSKFSINELSIFISIQNYLHLTKSSTGSAFDELDHAGPRAIMPDLLPGRARARPVHVRPTVPRYGHAREPPPGCVRFEAAPGAVPCVVPQHPEGSHSRDDQAAGR